MVIFSPLGIEVLMEKKCCLRLKGMPWMIKESAVDIEIIEVIKVSLNRHCSDNTLVLIYRTPVWLRYCRLGLGGPTHAQDLMRYALKGLGCVPLHALVEVEHVHAVLNITGS